MKRACFPHWIRFTRNEQVNGKTTGLLEPEPLYRAIFPEIVPVIYPSTAPYSVILVVKED